MPVVLGFGQLSSRLRNDVKNVRELYRTSGVDGKVFALGNHPGEHDLVGRQRRELHSDPRLPPYAYTLDATAGIPNAVTNNAGVGKGPFAP